MLSRIGGRRATEIRGDLRMETYVESMRPSATHVGHLGFHLRHEVTHLEFLARLFKSVGPKPLQDWINAEPTGGYARRAAFLYETLTGAVLAPPSRLGGNYVDVLGATDLVVATPKHADKVARWRVNDNLPGNRFFCPMIVKTNQTIAASALDVPALYAELSSEFGNDLLTRAATWMTLRESKASFAIEGEADKLTRVQRFADVIARRTAGGQSPLEETVLAELQAEILGELTVIQSWGLRQSPVFVGQVARYQEVVHYVAPPPQDLAGMLAGLRLFLARTREQSPVMRAAVAAFGFVYIHPLADGNGRVHRFLINDVLRRDGVIPAPAILPVSAVISADAAERNSYDQTLDSVSKPLMQSVRERVSFATSPITYPDGISSNLVFEANDEARPVWRYPDLGPHVQYLSDIVRRTISHEMREQSRYLAGHQRARAALKEVVEMPDEMADRVLRSIEQNNGQLSNALAKEIPLFANGSVWDELVKATKLAWGEPSADDSVVARYRPY